jgi:hypothetical protein
MNWTIRITPAVHQIRTEVILAIVLPLTSRGLVPTIRYWTLVPVTLSPPADVRLERDIWDSAERAKIRM